MWQQVVAALCVVILQGLAVRKVIGGEGEAGGSGEGLPVHPNRAAETRHCRRGRQQQDFRGTPITHTESHSAWHTYHMDATVRIHTHSHVRPVWKLADRLREKQTEDERVKRFRQTDIPTRREKVGKEKGVCYHHCRNWTEITVNTTCKINMH